MSSSCNQLSDFADGELAPASAESFRHHLLTCDTCPADLANFLALDALVADTLHDPPVSKTIETEACQPSGVQGDEGTEQNPPGDSRWRRAWRWLTGWTRHSALFPALAAAAVTIVALVRWTVTDGPTQVALEAPTCRSILGRLSDARYAQPVPCPVMRNKQSAGGSPVPSRVFAALERDGDYHRLAIAYLIDGDLAGAQRSLQRAGQSPEVQNDRAVIALEGGDSAQALAISSAVLAQAPANSAAAWNRAVALQRLGRRTEATQAFAAISRSDDPRWAEQARRQVALLSPAQ